MLLLHISDIHFRFPECDADDPDRPYRTSLLNDVRNNRRDLGTVDAILVTGDIAFRGLPTEYRAAHEWLGQLCDVSGCPRERVFVVPGNHDVDRTAITNSATVRNAQSAIIRAGNRERELQRQVRDPEAGPALFRPISAYNDFAASYNCQVFPTRPYWRQEFEISEGFTLRLYGLTTTFLSGAEGGDDEKGDLYVSPLQTIFDPVPNVVNLALGHHPPDWLSDGDDVEDALNGRVTLHAFGHKHRQRITREAAYMRFNAGAVNPDRQERGWQPGYNMVRLSVGVEGPRATLEIEAHIRVWQTNPDRFVPKLADDSGSIFHHQIPLHNAVIRARAEPEPQPAAMQKQTDPEVVMSSPATRNLVSRFWRLRASDRRDIMLRLGLIELGDLSVPEAERYGKALLAASERGLLERVAEEVQKAEVKHGED